ncbi:MAG: DUF6062 family protein, partial [Actinomycetota bacterium]|nr:DUF6062 family protein [Actinomycetota bacterium]
MKLRRRDPTHVHPIGFHDLLRDLEFRGCCVCSGATRSSRRYLDSLLWEFVTDGGIRTRLRAGHGFCREHTFLAIEVARAHAGDAGLAALYEDFLEHIRHHILDLRSPHRSARFRPGKRVEILIKPELPCRACESESGAVRAYLTILAHRGRYPEIETALEASRRGLCIPHLERGLTMFADAEPRAALVALYLKFEEELRADLRDFIRKRDYRFQDEPRGLEQESWWRAP